MAGDEQKNSPPTDASTPSDSAKARLEQVSSHIAPNTPKRRRRKATDSDLPADYSDILGQIATLRKTAATPDTSNRGYLRQKQAGKLWVRERVEQLLDEGSFQEVGSVSGTVKWKQVGPSKEEPEEYVPSNNVQGFGRLRGRKIVFTADDFSIRAGHADGSLMEKTLYMEKLSLSLKLPIVKLVDGSSGGGSVTTIRSWGYSSHSILLFPHAKHVVSQLNAGIPNLGAVLDIGSLFNAGPNVVKNATFEEDLSVTDLEHQMKAGCFEQIRTVLSYLPDCGTKLPPTSTAPTPSTAHHKLSAQSSHEPKTEFTRAPWTHSLPENNPNAKISRRLQHPLLQFVDIPGYAIGTVAERSATMRHGITLARTYYSTTMPIFNVHCAGVRRRWRRHARLPGPAHARCMAVWNLGSLPLEGGIEVGHSFELKEVERTHGKEAREMRYKELEAEYRRLMNPVAHGECVWD
ncbi:propionyl-CoA carboxylase beta chain mitochondrial precursor [Bipolaris maydis]|nr:propionyl-CoA carboxylase beta chain mitochondrial precursor [Bipolaris maydis]